MPQEGFHACIEMFCRPCPLRLLRGSSDAGSPAAAAVAVVAASRVLFDHGGFRHSGFLQSFPETDGHFGAGATVHFAANQGMSISGNLTAVGSSGSPIVFTSISSTTPGSWGMITFNAGSSGHLSYTDVSYGCSSGASTNGAINVNGGAGGTISFDNVAVTSSACSGMALYGTTTLLGLSSSAITGSAYYGIILLNGATANVTSTAFTNNGTYALSLDAGGTLTGLSGLSAAGNGGGARNGIEFRGGTVTGAQSWLPGLDWYVTSGPSVGSAGALTLGAGAIVHFAAGQGMNVGGNLTAAGTSGSPILLTSIAGTAPGSWGAVTFNSGSFGRLSYVTDSYGGAGGSPNSGALNVNGGAGGRIEFDNLTVTASASSGIALNGTAAALTLTASAISGSVYYGLTLLNGAGANVTTSTFANNGGYALSTAAGCPLTGLTGLTLLGNGGGAKNGIEHRGGVIAAPLAEVWIAGIPWYLTSGVGIGTGASLQLPAGLTVNLAGERHGLRLRLAQAPHLDDLS